MNLRICVQAEANAAGLLFFSFMSRAVESRVVY